jgi:ankyrin repeat protein
MKNIFFAITAALMLVSCGAEKDKDLVYRSSIGDTTLVASLIKSGAKINYSSFDDGLTPLIAAAQHGHLEVVKILISAGADINLKDGGGSPLFWAAFFSQKEVFKYLLSKGAILDATQQNISQLTLELEKNRESELLSLVLERYKAERK